MDLYSLTSDLHGEFTQPASKENFILDLEAAMGAPFIHHGNDFSSYGNGEDVIYVRTGGTEGLFKKVFCSAAGTPAIPGGRKVRLLTSGKSNSLAASMEILSFLRQHSIPAEIIHGTAESMAAALKMETVRPVENLHMPLKPTSGILAGKRLGLVGRPSDWLISSDVNYRTAREVLGVELIDIPMEELLDEFRSGRMEQLPELAAMNTPKFGKPISEKSFNDSMLVYSALKRIVEKHALDGLTLRCFDLLGTIGNTGCMALAILNSQGVTATCEGDVPAMLSMAVGKALTGCPGFQVNLSRAWDDQLLFAHCTVPLNMVNGYVYDTHFESGIGVAVHGTLPEGPATILKIGADLRQFMVRDVELVENQYESNLCRTQVVVKSEGLKDYMLTDPLGNHHVLLLGHHADAVKQALAAIQG